MKKFSIGIDLGGTKILTALVDRTSGEVVCSVKKKIRNEKGNEKVAEKILQGLEELFEIIPVGRDEISSVGIASAGQINRKDGVIIAATNLECYDLDLRALVLERYEYPVYVSNDVEAATLGEISYGAGRGVQDLVCVFVGTGVGACIVKNGKILQGATGTAGELGHIVVDVNGRPCACGANGCLEAYASRSAIEGCISRALKKGRTSIITEFYEEGKPITSGMIRKSIEKKDELVTNCVDEAAVYLSAGLANVINLINPKLIILGGGLIEAVDYFYQKTIKDAKLKSLTVPAAGVEFRKTSLGDFSGVIGAAILENY